MVKREPATPLPWAVDQAPSGHEIVNEETIFTVARCVVGRRSTSMAMVDKNAAYIVHAANAYPKLVEALTEAMDSLDDSVRAPKAKHDRQAEADRISSLLRGLGEMA